MSNMVDVQIELNRYYTWREVYDMILNYLAGENSDLFKLTDHNANTTFREAIFKKKHRSKNIVAIAEEVINRCGTGQGAKFTYSGKQVITLLEDETLLAHRLDRKEVKFNWIIMDSPTESNTDNVKLSIPKVEPAVFDYSPYKRDDDKSLKTIRNNKKFLEEQLVIITDMLKEYEDIK